MRATLLACLFLAATAHAQDSVDKAQADSLFDEGKSLMKSGDYAKACGDFEASLRIFPQLGTKMNLADCYEKSGKLASAWAEFRESASFAAKSGDKRGDFAKQRATEIEPRVDKIVIAMAADQVPGVTVTRDGQGVLPAIYGHPVPIDPGEVKIVASAAGYAEFATSVTVAGEGTTTTVEIPKLAPTAGPGPTTVAPVQPPPPTTPSPAIVPTDEPPPGSTRKTVGVALVVAGGVGLAAGTIFGVAAKGAWDDSRHTCDATNLCDAAGKANVDKAYTDARIADVAIGAGVALGVAGLVLWVTAPHAHHHPSVTVIPTAHGVALGGGF